MEIKEWNEKDGPSTKEINNRWRRTLETRHQIDYLLSSSKFGRRRMTKGPLKSTWKHVIQEDLDPLHMAMEGTGVLVV